jgi:putative spermidine/putrescine transport system substrate-binding protein
MGTVQEGRTRKSSNREVKTMKRILNSSTRVAALAVACVFGAGAAGAADSITVTSWGGAYQDAQAEAYFKPFQEETGIQVLEDEWNGELGKIRAMVETGSVNWDVVQVEAPELVLGCFEGLYEEIDWERLPPKEEFIEAAVDDCGVGTIVWSTVLAYDGDHLEEGPQSWADFWDVETFPGPRGLRRGPKFTLEFALMADGVPPGEVYEVLSTEEGVDRAFAKLDEIKEHIRWWEAGAQPPQWLASGEVVMTSVYNGRIDAANKEEGKNFKIVWDGSLYTVDSWVIPRGSQKKDAAMEFIAFASQPERQKELSTRIAYGPTNQNAVEMLPQEVAADLPTAPDNLEGAAENDTEFWVDNLERLTERFNAWVAQ